MKRIKSLFFCYFIIINSLIGQIPILYYDFESNETRTTFENAVEQRINEGSGAIERSRSLTISGVQGSGVFNGGSSTGESASGSGWQSTTTDPTTSATDYYQFTVNTYGLKGMAVSFNNYASATGPASVGILYSVDNNTFYEVSTNETGNASWDITSFDLSSISSIDNQSSITLRIYAYAGDRTGRSAFSSGGTFRIDNLTVSAKTITSSVTLLNYPSIGLCIKSGTTYNPTYSDLTINSSGNVTLSSILNLNGTLNLISGNITTTSSNLLTLGSSATVSGGSSSSFINGPLAHTVDATTLATKTFPIGKDTYYRPLTLAVTQDAATSTTYTAELFNAAPTSRTLPGTLDKVSTVRYWNITKSSGANVTAAAVTLNYDSDDGVCDNANLRVAKDDGSGNWIDIGGTGTANTSGSITSTTNFTSFSDFVLANANGGANPLPVELSSFTSVIRGNDVVLKWSTATEVNNYGFEIERSPSPTPSQREGALTPLGGDWGVIGFVNGNGNSNSIKEYSITDNTLTASGKYFYRLKQIDTDGQFEYSNEIEVNFTGENGFNLAQNYPNPFNPVTVINYQLPANSYVTLKVYDLLGKEVTTLVSGNMDAGNHNVNFNASSLSAGTYFYKLKAGDYTSVKKLMVVK